MIKSPDSLFQRDPGLFCLAAGFGSGFSGFILFYPYHCRSAALYSGSLPTWLVSGNSPV